jgi:hypothetical protein
LLFFFLHQYSSCDGLLFSWRNKSIISSSISNINSIS